MDKFREQITDWANWITIVFCIVLYTAIGAMSFRGGQIALKDFSNYTWFDWIIWGALTFIPAILSIIVTTTFSLEGLKQGKRKILDTIKLYQEKLSIKVETKRRSEREFLTQGTIKRSARIFTQTLLLSFVAGQLFIKFDWDNVVKLIINISIWLVFGISAYSKSFDYATTELKEWYIIETSKLKRGDNNE